MPIERHPVERTAAATSNVPEGLGAETISTFDAVTTETQFGSGWSTSTDALYGGKSTADFKAIEGGARTTKGALSVTGPVAAGQDFAWAGIQFSPGPKPMAVADLSSKKELVFSAKGDGATYQVLIFSEAKKFAPIAQSFVAGRGWREYRFPFSAFAGIDGHDIAGIAFVGGPKAGKVQCQLDEVRLEE